MTLTTDPRAVVNGRVAVSMTSKAKHDALLGRTALHTLADGTRVRGTIDGFESYYPRMTITAVLGDGDPTIVGRWCRLDSVVHLVAVEASR